MLSEIQALIFDMDGTLIDSMWVWEAIDRELIATYDLKEPEDFYSEMEGKSYSEVAAYYKRIFPQLPYDAEGLMRLWTDMAREKYLHEVPLKPGAREFLREAKARGLRIGIATSNTLDLVSDTLKSLEIDAYFDAVHSACEVSAGKPSPEIYQLVSRDLGIEPERCLVFEDVPSGILAGKRAGMRVCAVEDRFSLDLTERKKELADYYIRDFSQVTDETYETLAETDF